MKIAVWKFFSVTENVVQFNSKDLTEYIKVNGERFCCDQGDLMRMGNVSVYNIFFGRKQDIQGFPVTEIDGDNRNRCFRGKMLARMVVAYDNGINLFLLSFFKVIRNNLFVWPFWIAWCASARAAGPPRV